jgi:hypothetical protein
MLKKCKNCCYFSQELSGFIGCKTCSLFSKESISDFFYQKEIEEREQLMNEKPEVVITNNEVKKVNLAQLRTKNKAMPIKELREHIEKENNLLEPEFVSIVEFKENEIKDLENDKKSRLAYLSNHRGQLTKREKIRSVENVLKIIREIRKLKNS